MNKKPIWIFFIALIALASCGEKPAQMQGPSGPVPFKVAAVSKQNVTTLQEFITNLEGQQNVEIRPKVSGFIQKIYIDEGVQVKKGDLLFKLETQTLSQDAEAAKARVSVAELEVNRLAPLVEKNIVSKIQLETAKANLAQAKSSYSSIKANIDYAKIISPVDGIVGSLPYREGSLVSASNAEPLTIISDIRNVRAYFSLNEKQLLSFNKASGNSSLKERIETFPEVSLRMVDNTMYDHKGKVETINGLINERTGTVQFRALFPNPDYLLRSGGSGTIQIPTEEKDVMLIPQIAVFEIQGKKLVYVVNKNNKVESRVVHSNGTQALDFMVTDGLQEGEKIVVEGVSKLSEGQEIIPQEKTPASSTVSAVK